MRINKYIAQSGICSRRKAEELIKDKRVEVNGIIVDDLSFKVDKDDTIFVDGKRIDIENKFYYKLNKPVGYISSNYDPHNNKNLETLLDIDQRFFCAGRLDMDSHGLMIITNDGYMVNRLIHPKFEVKKEYIVKVDKLLNNKQEYLFEKPLKLGHGQIAYKQELKIINKKDKIYKVIISQGYKRQIRRMFAMFSSQVIDLKRIKIGQIELGNLEDGSYEKLSKKEMEFLSSL
ncbi:MAG: pseudouridine synthase [Peptoniphilaceae bacterium]|nr:pseudouridine synthase [Peptoniphilaceae bacterium]MDY6019385.1 pseudouridine synthase [Anaerococcus sp.]